MKPHILKLVVITALGLGIATSAGAQSLSESPSGNTVKNAKDMKHLKHAISQSVSPKTAVVTKSSAQTGFDAAGAKRILANQPGAGQMQQTFNARDRLTQSRAAGNKPAAGTRLDGHNPQVNGQISMPDFSQYSNATPSHDCISNPANCVRNNASEGPGRFTAPPTVGGGVPDQREKAGSGFNSQESAINNDGSGHIKAVYVDRQGNTTSLTREYSAGPQGGGTITTRITATDEKGKTTATMTTRERFDEEGNRVENANQHSGSMSQETIVALGTYVQNAEEEAMDRIDAAHESDQPGVDDNSVTMKDNCDWHPIVGCTKKSAKPDRGVIVDPSRGEQGGTIIGSSAPRLNSSAVTNPGDGSWGVSSSSGGNHGHPLDMRDPPKDDGTGPVPHGGFAP